MLSQEVINKIIGDEVARLEEEQQEKGFLDWEKAQKQIEENIRNKVSQAYESVGLPEGLNLCDNPVARGVKGVSDKVAETIADVTSTIDQVTQSILDTIALTLSAYNLPLIWSTTLSEVTGKIYCSFQTSRKATTEILPELQETFEFETPIEEEQEEQDPTKDRQPSEIIDALVSLRKRLETVHQNLENHSDNDFERFEDLLRRSNQINSRLTNLINQEARGSTSASFFTKSLVAEEGLGNLAKLPLPKKPESSKLDKLPELTFDDALLVTERLAIRNGRVVGVLLAIINQSSQVAYDYLSDNIGIAAQKIRNLYLLP